MADFFAQIPVFRHGYAWRSENEDSYATPDIPSEYWTRQCGSDSLADRVEHALLVAHGEHRPPLSDGSSWRFYDPFSDKPGLFREFADLTPHPWPYRSLTADESICHRKEILEFINRYGEFGHLEMPIVRTVPMQVGLMRQALELWDAIKAKDQDTLSRYLGFFKAGEYAYHRPPLRPLPSMTATARKCPWLEYVRHRFGGPEKLEGWGLLETPVAAAIEEMPEHWHTDPRPKASDILTCATDLFALLVHSQTLVDFTTPAKTAVRIARTTAAQLPTIRVQVDSLRHALWIQLAVSLIENRDYRRCKMCGKPFEVGVKSKEKTVPRD